MPHTLTSSKYCQDVDIFRTLFKDGTDATRTFQVSHRIVTFQMEPLRETQQSELNLCHIFTLLRSETIKLDIYEARTRQ